MPSPRHFRSGLAAGLLTLAAASAQAQSADMIPPMRSAGAASYTCGGIGSDESTAMRQAMKGHRLSLLFARPGGNYVADVAVTLKPAKGEAITFNATGPICLVDLPPGRYSVTAKAEGASKSQSVTVGGGNRRLDFRF
ncbi:MAG: carboxypeptidase regulatory-like domain-containing protein [Variovorax sp.]